MSDEISTDDLFGGDTPAAPKHAPQPPKAPEPHPVGFDGSIAELKAAAPDMTKGRLQYVIDHDTRQGARNAAQDELTSRVAPAPKPRREPIEIDNAVNIRKLDWECVCGNTNTLDLQQCGKCRDPRFTTN